MKAVLPGLSVNMYDISEVTNWISNEPDALMNPIACHI